MSLIKAVAVEAFVFQQKEVKRNKKGDGCIEKDFGFGYSLLQGHGNATYPLENSYPLRYLKLCVTL